MSTDFGRVAGVDLGAAMGRGLRREVYVHRFAGGEHGPCVQLTIDDVFVQLDPEGVRSLISKLLATGVGAG